MLNVKDRMNCLNKSNYVAILTFLLYLEEHQMSINIRQYDNETTKLKKLQSDLYELEVINCLVFFLTNSIKI